MAIINTAKHAIYDVRHVAACSSLSELICWNAFLLYCRYQKDLHCWLERIGRFVRFVPILVLEHLVVRL